MNWTRSENLLNDVSKFGSRSPVNSGLLSTTGYSEIDHVKNDKIEDYVKRSLDLLVEQFKQSNDLKNQITAFVDAIQELENVGNKFYENKNLITAGGKNLDGIGDIVGEYRNGRSDSEYRFGIQFKIFLNKSSGEIETIQNFVKYITVSNYARLDEVFPAKAFVYFDNLQIPIHFNKLVNSIACAGVKIYPVFAEVGNVFGFSGEGGISEDTNIRGFSELGVLDSNTGKYSELII